MRLFRRKPKPVAPPEELRPHETVERSVKATLLYGKEAKRGALHMTSERLLFEAEKGDARWLSVPYEDLREAGLYRWPGTAMGIPSSRQQCLVVQTAQSEQVWWDFDGEDEWLPLVRARIPAAEVEPSL